MKILLSKLLLCLSSLVRLLILDGAAKGNLSTLSLSGCALSANDIQPLYKALRQGMKLHMLKLSANRLEDAGVVGLAEAIAANKTHPLAVLDVSDNTVQPFLSYLFQCNVLFDGKNNFFNFIRYGFLGICWNLFYINQPIFCKGL